VGSDLEGPDRTLVTGATGFVGAAVARALIARGHRLRLTLRPTSDRRNLLGAIVGSGAELVEADLNDEAAIGRAVAGCRYVFHVAADYRLFVPDPQAMRRTNIEGTTTLLRAAFAAGVERAVYTSSVAALGVRGDGGIADEETVIDEAAIVGAYKRSKYDAEQAVRQLARGGMNVVIVNPAAPVGPGDVKPTPTGRMVRDAAFGKIPAFVDTGLNIVHVDDVAAGHVMAFEKALPGEAHILGGDNLMLAEILAIIARIEGRKAPTLRLPITPLVPVAAVMEFVARRTGGTPLMTREELAMARKLMFYSSEKSRRVLGYAPRPAREALADAIAWFHAERLAA
jgi:dihydroflavonol-4-reductase